MTKASELWHYFDETAGQWAGPVSRNTLDRMVADGAISKETATVSATMARRGGPNPPSIPYFQLASIPIEFDPPADDFLLAREDHFVTVLAGPNNCGKTLYLRQILAQLDHEAYLLQCNRFSHIDVLNTRQLDQHEYRRYYDNFIYNYHTAQQNQEINELNLEQLITSLKEPQLDSLFALVSELIGNKFSLKRVDPESRFSPYYIDMDGQNLRLASSGTRLLFSLLGLLFDQRFSAVLIDEPEIGLSPRVQNALATFLYQKVYRDKFFPHLRQVFLATHSHLFLDRTVLSNNFIVSRHGLKVSVQPVTSPSAMHHLQFNLLGNDLEALSLPSAIVVVEGESDQIFLTRIFQVYLPDKRVSVVRAGGDGEIYHKVNVLREALGDIVTGPYRDRLFAVLDDRNSTNKARLVNQGLRTEHIQTWSKNGIEYFYPDRRMTEVFACSEAELALINRESDPIEFNSIRRTKKSLSQEIAQKLTIGDQLHAELESFVAKIRQVTS